MSGRKSGPGRKSGASKGSKSAAKKGGMRKSRASKGIKKSGGKKKKN